MDLLHSLPANTVGRHKHPIWNYFSIDETTLAPTCRTCLVQFNGPPNTTNAKKHLKTRHPELFAELERTQKEGSESRSLDGDANADQNGEPTSEFSQSFAFGNSSLAAMLNSLAAGSPNGTAITAAEGVQSDVSNGDFKPHHATNGHFNHATASPVSNTHNDLVPPVHKRKRRHPVRPSVGATAEVSASNASVIVPPLVTGSANADISSSIGSYVSSIHADLSSIDPALALEFEEQCLQLCLRFRGRSLFHNSTVGNHNDSA